MPYKMIIYLTDDELHFSYAELYYVPKSVVSMSKETNAEFSLAGTGLKLPRGTASGNCSTSTSSACPIPTIQCSSES